MIQQVDKYAPSAPVLSGYPPAYTTSRVANIGISGEIGTKYYVYKATSESINGDFILSLSGILEVNTVYSISDLSVGTYSVCAVLEDNLGNMSVSSEVVKWTVYTYVPSAPILSGYPPLFTSSNDVDSFLKAESISFSVHSMNTELKSC